MDINEKLLYLIELFPRLKYAMSIINDQYNNKQLELFYQSFINNLLDNYVNSNIIEIYENWKK